MSNTELVSKDMAETDFNRFVELMDLDTDTNGMNDEEKVSFEQQRGRIISAMMKGALAINDEGEPVFTPQRSKNKEPITFREPDGSALQAMDSKKKTEDIGKLYASMGAITGQPIKTFSAMKMADLKICIALVTLFLA
jgi:hypothetical protein